MRGFLGMILVGTAALSACGGGGGQPSGPPPPSGPMLSLLAGGPGGSGNADGTGAAASFAFPNGLATDGAGNVYVADNYNDTIRKITPAGVVSTFAGTAGIGGSTDGTGAAALFREPHGVATDSAGNVYVADTGNDTIRKITTAGVVSTVAGTVAGSTDGTGAAASFYSPTGVAVDDSGNVYVADTGNDTIRKITPAGVVSTFAGTAGISGTANGTGAAARFSGPQGVATDSAGNVYVADSGNNTIRKITPTGVVSTLAGAAARFTYPTGVATDGAGNVYVADTGNDTIRKITPESVVSTFAGKAGIGGSTDGTGAAARFSGPQGVATDSAGNVYVGDSGNNTIGEIVPTGVVTTFAGTAAMTGSTDGVGAAARFSYPGGLATDSAGNVYVADTGNGIIRKTTPAGVVTTLMGRFGCPAGVAVDGSGNVYVADKCSLTIGKITPAGAVSTLAGTAGMSGFADGAGAAASFYGPTGVAVDGFGNVYVADVYSYSDTFASATIRKITPAGVVSTFAGTPGTVGWTDGTGPAARFLGPRGLATDSAGNVYVADGGTIYPPFNVSANTIRKITPAGAVTTLAAATSFQEPADVGVDSAGNVYVADTGNDLIRKITPAGVVTTIAGRPGESGFLPGPLPGLLTAPNSVALFGTTLYTTTNNAIVQVHDVP